MSKIIKKQPLFDWSKYDRTGNNAIDLVAQAVGYNRQMKRPIKSVILKASYYDLFKAGLEVLMKKRIEDLSTELTFDGVAIKKGGSMQFDSLRCEFYPIKLN